MYLLAVSGLSAGTAEPATTAARSALRAVLSAGSGKRLYGLIPVGNRPEIVGPMVGREATDSP